MFWCSEGDVQRNNIAMQPLVLHILYSMIAKEENWQPDCRRQICNSSICFVGVHLADDCSLVSYDLCEILTHLCILFSQITTEVPQLKFPLLIALFQVWSWKLKTWTCFFLPIFFLLGYLILPFEVHLKTVHLLQTNSQLVDVNLALTFLSDQQSGKKPFHVAY